MKKILLTLSLVGIITVEGFCAIDTESEYYEFRSLLGPILATGSNIDSRNLFLEAYVSSFLAISDLLPDYISYNYYPGYPDLSYASTIRKDFTNDINTIKNYFASGNYAQAANMIHNSIFAYAFTDLQDHNEPLDNMEEAKTAFNTNNFVNDYYSYFQRINESNLDDPFLEVNTELGLYDDLANGENGNGGNIPIDGGLSFLLLGGLGFGAYKMKKS